MQLEKKKRCIAFIGDSFCAAISQDHWIRNGSRLWQHGVESTNDAFPSLVADHYDLNLLAHGYGGKSWWYSRAQFLKQLTQTPKIINKLDAIVFCHTNYHRINSDSVYASSTNHQTAQRDENSYINEEDRQVSEAQVQWIKHLYDEEFQKWAQTNWFREITREWSHVKQVHFHCFADNENTQHNHLLVGQRFTTPLIHVSVAELAGSSREIRNQLMTDKRSNHLSDDNNQALAKITIDALDNYEHKVRPLDMSMFNIVNPNYANFPHGNFGSN